MKSYVSQIGHGRVVIMDSLDQAIACGYAHIDDNCRTFRQNAETKYKTVFRSRDGKERTGTKTGKQLAEGWDESRVSYSRAVEEITKGMPGFDKAEVQKLAADLRDAVLEIEPSLAKQGGLQRLEDGDEFLWELAEAGEERCCLGMAKDETPVQTKGDGAFRIVINTDVAWWCKPEDNAAVVGALIMLLMEWAACEVWIQQGWLCHGGGNGDDASGVTLFKLDFQGAFEPTQLAFWIGSPHKDATFSRIVNYGLGRRHSGTAIHCEVPADLYMHGPWMNADATLAQTMHKAEKLRGSDPAASRKLLMQAATEWIRKTAVKLLREEQAGAVAC